MQQRYKNETHTNTNCKYKYATHTNRNYKWNTCREATGTVGRVADKGREREAGSAERWYC